MISFVLFFVFKVSYRDPLNNLITLKNLRLEIKDFNSIPPQNTLAKKLLNDSVSTVLTNGIANNEREIDTEQYQLHIRSRININKKNLLEKFFYFRYNTLV